MMFPDYVYVVPKTENNWSWKSLGEQLLAGWILRQGIIVLKVIGRAFTCWANFRSGTHWLRACWKSNHSLDELLKDFSFRVPPIHSLDEQFVAGRKCIFSPARRCVRRTCGLQLGQMLID